LLVILLKEQRLVNLNVPIKNNVNLMHKLLIEVTSKPKLNLKGPTIKLLRRQRNFLFNVFKLKELPLLLVVLVNLLVVFLLMLNVQKVKTWLP
jgi:hypothetical protein